MTTQTSTISRFAAVWALQCFGALALLGIGYWWLTWPDEQAWQLLSSAVVAVLLLIAFVWLEHKVFSEVDQQRRTIVGRAISSYVAFAIWLGCFAVLEALLVKIWSGVEQTAVRVAQVLHLPPRATTSVLDWAAWGLVWIVLPALLLPVGSVLARSGSGPLRDAFCALGNLRYWVGVCLALLVGAYVPRVLIDWTPERATLNGEMWSAVLRLGLAYILAVTAVVFVSWNTAQTLPQNPPDNSTEVRSAAA